MIDKYKVLNNEKVQFDRYDEVKTDNEKMKNIMKSKLKSRKQVNKKLIAASISATLVLGSVALTNETTWAYIDTLVSHIESFLGRDYSEFDKYKFEGNQSIEDNGLVLNLGDVMLDDRQLIISLSMDYTNFDFKEHGINKKDFIRISIYCIKRPPFAFCHIINYQNLSDMSIFSRQVLINIYPSKTYFY